MINQIKKIFKYFKDKKQKKLLQDKCNKYKQNPVLFSQRYLNFYLQQTQKEILKLITDKKSIIARGCRRSGKTITIKNSIIHQLIFNKKSICLVNHTTQYSLAIIKEVANDLKYIAPEFGLKIVNYNNGCIYLSNGSSLWLKYKQDADIIYFDEFALLPQTKIQETYHQNTSKAITQQIIIMSTEEENTLFNSLWNQANYGMNYLTPVEIQFNDY